MTGAWTALETGWSLLLAEWIDGRTVTTTAPALGYAGVCVCRPDTVLSDRGGVIVEVETGSCACTGAVARLLPPGVTDEQIAAVRERLTRRLVDRAAS